MTRRMYVRMYVAAVPFVALLVAEAPKFSRR